MPPPGGWPDDHADVPGLNGDFLARFNLYREAVYQRTGIVIGIRDGFRSTALQIQRRIENCGGNTPYNVWQKPPSRCSPATAIPGTSNHEKGLAIDQYPHYTAHPYIAEAANLAGLGFYVYKEPWHIEPKWIYGKPVPPLADVPRLLGLSPTVPEQPPKEKEMDRYAMHDLGGVIAEAVLNPDGTAALLKFSPRVGALPPAGDPDNPLAGWANFADYVGGWPRNSDGSIYRADAVALGSIDVRFRLVIRTYNIGQAPAFAAFQAPGTSGPPHQWDLNGLEWGGHRTGWYPA
jgi:hypothetical protein